MSKQNRKRNGKRDGRRDDGSVLIEAMVASVVVTRGAASPTVTCVLTTPTIRTGLISTFCPTANRKEPFQVSSPADVAVIS